MGEHEILDLTLPALAAGDHFRDACPLVGGGLDLVKTSLGAVVQGEQFDVMGPAKAEATVPIL